MQVCGARENKMEDKQSGTRTKAYLVKLAVEGRDGDVRDAKERLECQVGRKSA